MHLLHIFGLIRGDTRPVTEIRKSTSYHENSRIHPLIYQAEETLRRERGGGGGGGERQEDHLSGVS